MKNYTQMSVGEIVADNFENAAIFERYGAYFCCNGAQSLPEACRKAGAGLKQVIAGLDRQMPRWARFAAM